MFVVCVCISVFAALCCEIKSIYKPFLAYQPCKNRRRS